MFFIDREVKGFICLRHHFLIILKIEIFRFLQDLAHSRFTQEFDQGLVFRQTSVDAEQRKAAILFVALGNQFLGIG